MDAGYLLGIVKNKYTETCERRNKHEEVHYYE